MNNARPIMHPPILSRLVLTGLVVWSLGFGVVRGDDGTKVDLKPLIDLKPPVSAEPKSVPALPPPLDSAPAVPFVPSVAVPAPPAPRPVFDALPGTVTPRLSVDPIPLLDTRPKVDVAPLDVPKTEAKVEPLFPLNPDVTGPAGETLTSRAKVLFDTETPGQTRISIDGRPLGEMQSLLGEQSVVTAYGVALSYAEGKAVNVSSKTREVMVEVTGIPRWAARISANNQAAFRFNAAKTYADVLTPVSNTDSVIIRFPDSGMAELGADSSCRVDFFKDQSYYVSGAGLVKAQTPDGQFVFLSHQVPLSSPQVQSQTIERSIGEAPRPPLPSGPMPPVSAAAGKAELVLAPITDVLISGTFASGLSVVVGDRTVELNSGKTSESVSLPNGSEIEFTLDQAAAVLAWRVSKGYFRLRLDSEAFRLWRATALTEQSGTLRWDKMVFPPTLELKNTTAASPRNANNVIMVDLARDVAPYGIYFDAPQSGFYASVNPNCTFSYSPSDGPADEAGNRKFRVGASAPVGGVNLYRVLAGIADTGYNKELLLGTDCFCVESIGRGGASRAVEKIARGANFAPLPPTGPSPGTFTLLPTKALTPPIFVPVPATPSGGP